MLDLFCGRFGWGKVFAQRGWEVVGIDLIQPPEVPDGCTFIKADILNLRFSGDFVSNNWFLIEDGRRYFIGHFDAVCCSSPCEQFSLFGMSHFHPDPPYPEMGIKLFNHTRAVCEASGCLYVMENVKRAQDFVGVATNHCGPFYLWGSGVPMLMPMGIKKGIQHAAGFRKDMTVEEKRLCRLKDTMCRSGSKSKVRREHTAIAATIPLLLANCVVDYVERLSERRPTA
jgi:hypothetical protein